MSPSEAACAAPAPAAGIEPADAPARMCVPAAPITNTVSTVANAQVTKPWTVSRK
jgi:hypothetical protein